MRLDSSAPERTSPEEHFLSDLLSSAQQVPGLLLQRLESEKSQWLFPEVEWCFYSHIENQWVLQKQLLPRAVSSALLLVPQGTQSCHARVAEAQESGTVHKCCPGDCCVTGHCSPGVFPLSVQTIQCSQCIHPCALTSSPLQGLESRASSTEPLWISHPAWMPSAGVGLSL